MATSPSGKSSRKKSAPRKSAAKKAVSKQAARRATEPAPSPARSPTHSRAVSEDPIPASLSHMPVSLFGAGLGIAGFAAAWREAAIAFDAGGDIGRLLTGIAFGFFLAICVLYAVKYLRHPDAVLREFHHPVLSNFFSAATMTLLVLTSSLGGDAPTLAPILWGVAAAANVTLTIAIVGFWISRDCHVSHAAPVWFIPVAGNLLIPIVGAPLGFVEIGWMMLAVGLLFWIVLFTIVFYRLLFEQPIEANLKPTLFILVAPPALAFIAYVVLSNGVVDGMATMLLGLSTFMLLLLLPQVPALAKAPFGLSWWSYIFPLSAFSIAWTLYADAMADEIARSVAIGVIALLSVLFVIVIVRTTRYILAGRVFRPVEAPLPKA
jgi:tellurite resistance protein